VVGGIGRRDRGPHHLGVARGHRLVDGGAVEGEARLAEQVSAFAGAFHHAEPEVVPGEQRFDAADPRRPVGADGGEQGEPVGLEPGAYVGRQLRGSRRHLGPRRHRWLFLSRLRCVAGDCL